MRRPSESVGVVFGFQQSLFVCHTIVSNYHACSSGCYFDKDVYLEFTSVVFNKTKVCT